MRVTLLTMCLMILSGPIYADEIQIYFPIKVDDFKAYTKSHGLDLNDKDGFIENKGQNFVVYTYKTATPEQMEIIKDATFKNLRK